MPAAWQRMSQLLRPPGPTPTESGNHDGSWLRFSIARCFTIETAIAARESRLFDEYRGSHRDPEWGAVRILSGRAPGLTAAGACMVKVTLRMIAHGAGALFRTLRSRTDDSARIRWNGTLAVA